MVLASVATLGVAAGADRQVGALKLPHSRMNCHLAFDYVQKQLDERTGAVGTAATGWTMQHKFIMLASLNLSPPPSRMARKVELLQ